jgi:hypothetical protein
MRLLLSGCVRTRSGNDWERDHKESIAWDKQMWRVPNAIRFVGYISNNPLSIAAQPIVGSASQAEPFTRAMILPHLSSSFLIIEPTNTNFRVISREDYDIP